MHSANRGISAILLAAMALPAAARPGGSATAESLLTADTARFQAMVRGDLATLDRALGAELVYVHSSGVRQGKAEQLDDIAKGKARYARIDVEEHAPALYGKVGLIQGVATFVTGGPDAGQPFTLRYTDVYVWREGRWQMIAWHCTRLARPGPRPAPPAAAQRTGTS